MNEESKSTLLYIAVLTFGVLLIVVVWTLATNYIEDQAAIRCATYNYKCPKEDDK